nr:bifunctional cytochrome p450/nadph--p450 reductase [Quercus suber]
MDLRDTTPIPGPKGYPIVGNVTDVDPELPIASLQTLAHQYGEIFSLTVFGRRITVIASQRLLNEVCDEKRFGKAVKAALAELRAGITDGLFTAHNEEKNWMLAHKILVPAFGPLNINDMFPDMKDIASQLILKWARYGPDHVIQAAEDYTRLTLDTLALCAMGYRFNSFYSDEMHPFILAMTRFLQQGGARARRPPVLSPFYRSSDNQFNADIAYMRELSDSIIRHRIDRPDARKDLLSAMLNGKDPKTNETLSHDNIISNMITFLIAGHETTSGLLSFLFYYFTKQPEAHRKAQEEVDRVVGKASVKVENLAQLPYITACLRETLRLQPTAPAFTVSPKSEDGAILGGKYFVPHGEAIRVLLPAIHRDHAVFGDDADAFKPERMLEENFNKLPKNAWKPCEYRAP